MVSNQTYWWVLGLTLTLASIVYADVLRRVSNVEEKADKVAVIESNVSDIKQTVKEISKQIRDLELKKGT